MVNPEGEYGKIFLGIMKKQDRIEVFGRNDNFIKKVIERGYEIVAFEKLSQQRDYESYNLVELKMYQTKKSWLMQSYSHSVSYSRLLCILNRHTVRDIKRHIYNLMRPFINLEETAKLIGKNHLNRPEEEQIQIEY